MRHAELCWERDRLRDGEDRGLVGIAVPADDGFAQAAVTVGNGSV